MHNNAVIFYIWTKIGVEILDHWREDPKLLLSRSFGDPYDRTGHEFHIWETPRSSGSRRQENLQELCSESHAEVLTWLNIAPGLKFTM